jgi:phage-related protein
MFGALLGAVGGMITSSKQSKQSVEQAKQALAQARIAADNAKASYKNIGESAARDMTSFGRMTEQLSAKSRQQLGARSLEASNQLSSLNAMLGDLGVMGRSHQMLRGQLMSDLGMDQSILKTNAKNTLAQSQDEFAARMANYQSQINGTASAQSAATANLQAGITPPPSPLGGFMSNIAGTYSKDKNVMTTMDAVNGLRGIFNFGPTPGTAAAVASGISPI